MSIIFTIFLFNLKFGYICQFCFLRRNVTEFDVTKLKSGLYTWFAHLYLPYSNNVLLASCAVNQSCACSLVWLVFLASHSARLVTCWTRNRPNVASVTRRSSLREVNGYYCGESKYGSCYHCAEQMELKHDWADSNLS